MVMCYMHMGKMKIGYINWNAIQSFTSKYTHFSYRYSFSYVNTHTSLIAIASAT